MNTKNLSILAMALLFLACSENVAPKKATEDQMETKTILALGDSYTIGESVSEAERWPNQLAARLNASDSVVKNPTIVARTGWNTNQLTDAIKQRSDLQPPYDLVTLLIGVNDQYQGRGINFMREGFLALLDTAVAFAGSDSNAVIVVSIPDYSVTPFGQNDARGAQNIRRELQSFNALQKQFCAERGIAYVDIWDISLKAENDLSYLAPDQLHPSGKMYTEWVDLVAPVAQKKLGLRD